MEVTLVIDNREPAVIKESFAQTGASLANLAAGDFEFLKDGKSLMLIERKEISDLCSSLVDGRFDDQKRKLAAAACESPRPIVLLIEGDYSKEPENIRNTIESVVLTSRFRDGIFVLTSVSASATVTLLRHILTLFQRGKFEPLDEEEQHRRFIASRAAHRVGGQLSRKTDWWQLALAQIDGVGPKAAKAIAEKYPTAKNLLDAYRACKSDHYRGIMLSETGLGTRKLGPKISQRVWDTISGGEVTLRTQTAQPYKKAFASSSGANSKPYVPKPPTTECLFAEGNDDE